jgi:catechol 2,3-dioxygenase-like lactoylglutathione lyase family enzyme
MSWFKNGEKKKSGAGSLPGRLHHTAYVTKDMEATRKFYEDVIGLPLMATFCEEDELFGAVRTYMHTFFGLADGSALAFFQFANPADQEEFGPQMPFSPFHHIALHVEKSAQDEIEARIKAAGYTEPGHFVLEHGYCRSVYVTDPNGMIVEFCCDDEAAMKDAPARQAKAHAELKRWLGGDHRINNTYRGDHAA